MARGSFGGLRALGFQRAPTRARAPLGGPWAPGGSSFAGMFESGTGYSAPHAGTRVWEAQRCVCAGGLVQRVRVGAYSCVRPGRVSCPRGGDKELTGLARQSTPFSLSGLASASIRRYLYRIDGGRRQPVLCPTGNVDDEDDKQDDYEDPDQSITCPGDSEWQRHPPPSSLTSSASRR
jgi:hypothetical protein